MSVCIQLDLYSCHVDMRVVLPFEFVSRAESSLWIDTVFFM